jgi:hypothetical protein
MRTQSSDNRRQEWYAIPVFLVIALVGIVEATHALPPLATRKILSGVPAMTHQNTHSTIDTLEKFNKPDIFYATRSSFDIEAFMKNSRGYGIYEYVRKDGVHIRQLGDFGKAYKEELSRPDSHYVYEYGYHKNGRLQAMAVNFCDYGVGDVLYFNEEGNFIKKKNFDESYLPIEPLRTRFLEATRIDIYNTELVVDVFHAEHGGKIYYDIYVRKEPASNKLTAYLLDGATGTLLFKADAKKGFSIGPSAYRKYADYLKSIGQTPDGYLKYMQTKDKTP